MLQRGTHPWEGGGRAGTATAGAARCIARWGASRGIGIHMRTPVGGRAKAFFTVAGLVFIWVAIFAYPCWSWPYANREGNAAWNTTSTSLDGVDGAVVSDPDSGALVCTSCGLVHDAGSSEFVHQTAFTDEGRLDFRAASFVHHHSLNPYRDNKLAAASSLITSTASRLGLSPTRADEVLLMAKTATPGTAFLPALAAACAFLVARSHRLPLSLAEAAEARLLHHRPSR